MQVQNLSRLNFIIIIIFLLNQRHKKRRKNEFHQNWTIALVTYYALKYTYDLKRG
jgi:hypothetical protein